jgi:hypothetical protein
MRARHGALASNARTDCRTPGRSCAYIIWHFAVLSWGELCSSMLVVPSGAIKESL